MRFGDQNGRMKSTWLTVWFVSFVLLGHGGTGESMIRLRGSVAGVELTEAERAWVRAHPEVRWGSDPNWPPFTSYDAKRKLIGIDADLTRLAAERAGLRIVPVETKSWSEVLAKARSGTVDFLSGTARTAERMEDFDFTEEYCTFPVVMIVKDDGPFMTFEQALGSMKVAMERDNVITVQLQQDFPRAQFILTDSVESALRMVSRGTAEVTVHNLAVATSVIRVKGLTNLKISGVTHYEFPLRFAVRKDAPELKSILNKGLATITRGEQERIHAAHLVPDVAQARDWSAWRRRALYALLLGATAVAIVSCWNFSLRRQIRHRKTAESRLFDSRERLKERTQELDLRLIEVERLNGELQIANQDLGAFSSSVSHDLRAPLRRMARAAELIQAESGDCLTDDARHCTSMIIQESKRMTQLIHDLLEYARFGRAELHKESFNMRQLVEDVIVDFQPLLKDRRVVWKVGDLGEVHGDPELLRLAMTNLLDNALKYSRRCPEAHIEIDVMKDGVDGEEAAFYVKDDGCGFDMSMAKNLFAPFSRLHPSKDYEGTGIGLANVQKIIQRHDGRIWFESAKNKGATFFFTLPKGHVH